MKPIVAHFCRNLLNPTETFIKNQIEGHSKLSPVIVFNEFISHNSYSKELFEKYPALDLGYSTYDANNRLYSYLRILNKRKRKKVISFLKENNAAILHFHFGTDAAIFLRGLRSLDLPKFVSFYGYDCSSFPKKFFSLGKLILKRRTFKYADFVLAMSEDMKEDLIKTGCPKEKIIIHYFGSKLENFASFKRDYSEKTNITLLIIATLTPKKGHFDLFIALKYLVDKGIKNFTLRVIGDGLLKSELKQLTKNLNIEKYVDFVGALPYLSAQMLDEIQNANIFVHPSVKDKKGNKEGIPTIIIEAMASGLPVVTTKHAGIPSVIENNFTGLMVDEHDTKMLANNILKLINNSNLRKEMGENAQNFALSNLNIEGSVKKLEEMYLTL